MYGPASVTVDRGHDHREEPRVGIRLAGEENVGDLAHLGHPVVVQDAASFREVDIGEPKGRIGIRVHIAVVYRIGHAKGRKELLDRLLRKPQILCNR
jgi:hypothetical protein